MIGNLRSELTIIDLLNIANPKILVLLVTQKQYKTHTSTFELKYRLDKQAKKTLMEGVKQFAIAIEWEISHFWLTYHPLEIV